MKGKEYADKEYKDLNEEMKGIIARAFEAGLKQHEHDYLVKTKKIRNEYEEQIEIMKYGGNCKHEYRINTAGCFYRKCRFTGLDCTNCKDKWEIKEK